MSDGTEISFAIHGVKCAACDVTMNIYVHTSETNEAIEVFAKAHFSHEGFAWLVSITAPAAYASTKIFEMAFTLK